MRRALRAALDRLHCLPPLVTSWEVLSLRQQFAEVAHGQRFLLQGGDCSESFADCASDIIACKLKILLQMSLLLIHGSKKPVTRVVRLAGQYAKPPLLRPGNSRRRGPAQLSGGPRQSAGVYGGRPPGGPPTDAHRLFPCRPDAQLHSFAGRGRFFGAFVGSTYHHGYPSLTSLVRSSSPRLQLQATTLSSGQAGNRTMSWLALFPHTTLSPPRSLPLPPAGHQQRPFKNGA